MLVHRKRLSILSAPFHQTNNSLNDTIGLIFTFLFYRLKVNAKASLFTATNNFNNHKKLHGKCCQNTGFFRVVSSKHKVI